MSSLKPIKSCVLGVGLGGLTFHIPFVLALPELFTLHAVLERKPTGPGGKIAARFGPEVAQGVKIYRDYEEVLGDSELGLVIISTPSGTHYDLARRALEAGKHALVDKPVTATATEAHELGALAKSKNLVLYPFQNRRWDADFLTLRKLLALPSTDPKSLGTLLEFESRHDRYRTFLKGTWKDHPAPANGLTYDLGSHLIDQSLVLFGRPTKLTAMIENVRGIGSKDVDDNVRVLAFFGGEPSYVVGETILFSIFLHYPPRLAPSGLQPASFTVILRAHIISARSPQVRYVVRGVNGTYTKFGVDIQEEQLKAIQRASEIVQSSTYGQEPESLWGTLENLTEGGEVVKSIWPTTEKGNYAGLYRDLAATIREGQDQAIKWEESAQVIEIIELAYQSAKEERTVVLPPRP